jgi:hypothetical protein
MRGDVVVVRGDGYLSVPVEGDIPYNILSR